MTKKEIIEFLENESKRINELYDYFKNASEDIVRGHIEGEMLEIDYCLAVIKGYTKEV